jgi:hypothetical protein
MCSVVFYRGLSPAGLLRLPLQLMSDKTPFRRHCVTYLGIQRSFVLDKFCVHTWLYFLIVLFDLNVFSFLKLDLSHGRKNTD